MVNLVFKTARLNNFRRVRLETRIGAFLVAVVSLFAVSQILTTAHAAKFGDGPHEHGGQVCVLSLVAPNLDKAFAAAAVLFVVANSVWRAADQLTQSERALLVIRAAQPRGPPSF